MYLLFCILSRLCTQHWATWDSWLRGFLGLLWLPCEICEPSTTTWLPSQEAGCPKQMQSSSSSTVSLLLSFSFPCFFFIFNFCLHVSLGQGRYPPTHTHRKGASSSLKTKRGLEGSKQTGLAKSPLVCYTYLKQLDLSFAPWLSTLHPAEHKNTQP